MAAYKVHWHRVCEICKTRYYLPRSIRKRDYHTAFSQYTQYVRHNHNAMFNINRVTRTQSMWTYQCYNFEYNHYTYEIA